MPDAKIRWTADAKQAIAETQKLEKATGETAKQMRAKWKDLAEDAAGAFAVISGAILVAKKGFEFAQEGAEIAELRQAGQDLAATYELSMDRVVAAVKRGASGTINEMAAIAASSRVMNLGVITSEKQFQQLATVAEALADRLGKSTEQSMVDVGQALTVMNARTLVSAGITADADAVWAAYAKTIGKSVKDLTDAEKRTALLEDAVNRLGGGAASAADEFDRFGTRIDDSKARIQAFVGTAGGGMLGWFNDMHDAAKIGEEVRRRGLLTDERWRELVLELSAGHRDLASVLNEVEQAAAAQEAAGHSLTAQMMIQDEITKGLAENTEAGGMAMDRLAERNRNAAERIQGAVDDMNAAWGALDPSPLDDLLSLEKMTAWREVGGAALNDFIADLETAAIAGQDISDELDLAQSLALALQVQAGEIDLTEAKAQAKDLGLAWKTDVAPYIDASRKDIEAILRANGREVRIKVVTSYERLTGDTGHGRQHGGRLTGVNLVGEAGPEMIVNGVVIPAGETRRLMALGLLPGRRMQGGGKVFYPESKGAPETQSLVRHLTSGSGKAPQGQEAWRPAQMAQVAAAVASQATAAAVGAVGGQIAAVQLAQSQELQRQATQQAAADAEQNRLLREIADAVRATGTPGQIGAALGKEMQTFQAGG
jgi:hypothetical protein